MWFYTGYKLNSQGDLTVYNIYLLNEISWRMWGSSKKVSRHGKQPDGGSLCQDSTGFSEDAKFVNQTTFELPGP